MQSNNDGRMMCTWVLQLKLSSWLWRPSQAAAAASLLQCHAQIGRARRDFSRAQAPGCHPTPKHPPRSLPLLLLLRGLSTDPHWDGPILLELTRIYTSWEPVLSTYPTGMCKSVRIIIQWELSLKWISKTMHLTYESLGIQNGSFYILGIQL